MNSAILVLFLILLVLLVLVYIQGYNKELAMRRMRDLVMRCDKELSHQKEITVHYKEIIRRLWEQMPAESPTNVNLDFAHPSRVVFEPDFLEDPDKIERALDKRTEPPHYRGEDPRD